MATSYEARVRIVTAARAWIGTPYRHRASLIGCGCDCLGLLRGVWRQLVGPEPEPAPPYSGDWAEASGAEPLLTAAGRHLAAVPIEAMRAGDILLFRLRSGLPVKHCAVLVDGARMVHAQEGIGVCEVHLSNWWRRRIAAAFELPVAD